MRRTLHEVEQIIHTLDIRSDDPDIVHSQLDQCLVSSSTKLGSADISLSVHQRIYKTLADIKSEVEYVIRIGRGIVEKRQTDESSDLTRQIDQLKATYNNLGAKVGFQSRRKTHYSIVCLRVDIVDQESIGKCRASSEEVPQGILSCARMVRQSRQ